MENPRSLAEAKALVEAGDVATTTRLLAGEFNDLPMNYEEPIAQVTEIDVTEAQEEQEDSVGIPNVVSDDSEPDFDTIDHERKLYDEEMKRIEARERELSEREAKALSIAEAERKEKERLLKELDETRKAFDLDYEDEIAGATVANQSNDHQPVETGGTNLAEELEALKRQFNEEKIWANTVSSYTDFWGSSIGKELAPKGKPSEALQSFDNFYADLSQGFGNERDALRLMHDIRKNGLNEHYKQRLDAIGVEVPNDYEKLYDSVEVRAFSDGSVIDPKRGQLVPSGRGSFTSYEDAYFILHKDAIRQKERMSAMSEIKNKLREKDESAVVAEPSAYRSIPSANSMRGDKATMESMIGQAIKLGFNGDFESIKDPQFKQEFMKMYGSLMSR